MKHILIITSLSFILISCSGKPKEYLCSSNNPESWGTDHAYFKYDSNKIIFIPFPNTSPDEYTIKSEDEYSIYAIQNFGPTELYFDKKLKGLHYRVARPGDGGQSKYSNFFFICKDYE